jgi:dTDP-4-dehydrorhamnose reductase
VTRVLVTGASGLLGTNLVLHAADAGHRVVAASLRRPVEIEGVESVQTDLSLAGESRRVMENYRPNWVVHCAALTDLDRCQGELEAAFRLNAEMAEKVAHAARSIGAQLAHISTDSVFDGRHGGYTEADTPAPLNVYGKSKLAGERAVSEADPEALIIRTNFFGWSVRPGHGLAEWFLNELEGGRECPGFTDVWFSPLLANDLCDILLDMLESGASGLLHIPGAECVSKYDFGVRLAEAFGFDPALVTPVSIGAARLIAPRGERLCLRAERLTADFGRRPPGLDRGLAGLKTLRESAYLARLRNIARSQPS